MVNTTRISCALGHLEFMFIHKYFFHELLSKNAPISCNNNISKTPECSSSTLQILNKYLLNLIPNQAIFSDKSSWFSPCFKFIAWNCIIKIDLSKIHGPHLPPLCHFMHSYPSQSPLQQRLTSGTGFINLSAWSGLPFQIPLKTISFSFYLCYCIP